ncbi:hypothetical protein D3C73_545850 [compost metagenome]
MRTDAGDELHQPETGHAVARILGETQGRQHIFHMGAVQKLQAAEFDEGNVAAGEFHFQRAGMVRGAKKHGLLFQCHAGLAIFQHLLDDVIGLLRLVLDGNEARALFRLAVGPEVLGKALAGKFDDAVCSRKDRVGRAIIAVQRDDVGRRIECIGEIENVADRRGAERIDRLRVIADDGQAMPAGFQAHQDRGLQPVGILIFVDHDVIEAGADIFGD